MKKCATCKQDKPVTEFNKKSSTKDGLERYCKDCHRARNRKHYEEHTDEYKASAKKFKKQLKEWFVEYKSTLVCCKCGETKYWRLDFHHTDPSTKETDVSRLVTENRSRKVILAEIDKCIVVCRNCHADIHYEQEYN